MSTPFYEYMDTIVSPIELEIRKNISSSKLLNKNYYQNIQFSIDRNKIETLKISRENKSKQCDIRAIIRFFQTEIIDDETNQKTTKDSFPFYLQIYVNGKSINLSQYLPYDRIRKDGRRHPQPVDITDVLFDDDISQHKCVIKWIPYDMEEKFFFVVHLVRRRGCDELSLILMKNQTLSIENTLNFIMELTGNQKNHLADKSGQTENVIITSLNCPISWIRMTIPVRGQNCTHLQCFDCVTYLIMNFRKPMWLCPICSERTLFLSLRVDSFILQVIKDEQSKFIDEISINKLGQWKSIESFPLSNPDEEVLNIKDNSDINGLHNRECDMSSNINIEETTDTNSEELCGHSRSSAFPTVNSGSSESSAGIINADRNSYSSLESRPNVGKSTGTKPAMVINSPIARVPVSPCQNNEDEKSKMKRHQNIRDFRCYMPGPPVQPHALDAHTSPYAHTLIPTTIQSNSFKKPDIQLYKLRNEVGKPLNIKTKSLVVPYSYQTIPNSIYFETYPSEIRTDTSSKYYQQLQHSIALGEKEFVRAEYSRTIDVPNNLKLDRSEKDIVICKYGEPLEKNIDELIPRVQRKTNGDEKKVLTMTVHVVNAPIRIENGPEKWVIPYANSIRFNIAEGNKTNANKEAYRNFRITPLSVPSVIALEVNYQNSFQYVDDMPIMPIKSQLEVTPTDMANRRSFIRQDLTQDQIRSLLLFVDTEMAQDLQSQPHVISITIMDIHGTRIMDKRICPRNRVGHCMSYIHGINVKELKGEMDEEELLITCRLMFRGSILVGHDLYNDIKALRIPVEELMGIRDLASARCLATYVPKNTGQFFRLKDLARLVIKRKIQEGYRTAEENAGAIREIYLAVEYKWRDDINSTEEEDMKEPPVAEGYTSSESTALWLENQRKSVVRDLTEMEVSMTRNFPLAFLEPIIKKSKLDK